MIEIILLGYFPFKSKANYELIKSIVILLFSFISVSEEFLLVFDIRFINIIIIVDFCEELNFFGKIVLKNNI
jgi:hypothetical protein